MVDLILKSHEAIRLRHLLLLLHRFQLFLRILKFVTCIGDLSFLQGNLVINSVLQLHYGLFLA